MTRRRPLSIPVDELSSVLSLTDRTPPLSWSELFGREGNVELEIGAGKGLFLSEMAALHPETDFVGVERARKYFTRGAERLSSDGRPNVRVVCAEAFDFLLRWVAPRSVRRVHVYFPDPWPKKRHTKRRLLQPELYRLAARALRSDGEFFVASDVAMYFEEAMADLEHCAWFERAPWPESEPGRVSTHYARKYEAEGRALCYARFTRTLTAIPADPAPSPPLHALSGTHGDAAAATVGGRVAPTGRRREEAKARP